MIRLLNYWFINLLDYQIFKLLNYYIIELIIDQNINLSNYLINILMELVKY